MNTKIPIVIPAYQPDERLIELCAQLNNSGFYDILVIDDGSGIEYRKLFSTLKDQFHCTVLRHAVNLGKGRALKYAFNTLLDDEEVMGCVTADSDGQHTPVDIKKCINALKETPEALILGCRNFESDHIPLKSKIGNKLTIKISKFLCGLDISDTQTGLRGIPRKFMTTCLRVSGERFEYETNMLLAAKDEVGIREETIETVYNSKDNHQTHFDPIKDSIRIYLILGKVLLKYSISSIASCAIDLMLFALFLSIFEQLHLAYKIIMATAVARIISTAFNYIVNYKYVFKSNAKHQRSVVKYLLLAIIIMSLSGLGVVAIAHLLPNVSLILIKVIIDSLLFFVSFHIQRKYFFTRS